MHNSIKYRCCSSNNLYKVKIVLLMEVTEVLAYERSLKIYIAEARRLQKVEMSMVRSESLRKPLTAEKLVTN